MSTLRIRSSSDPAIRSVMRQIHELSLICAQLEPEGIAIKDAIVSLDERQAVAKCLLANARHELEKFQRYNVGQWRLVQRVMKRSEPVTLT